MAKILFLFPLFSYMQAHWMERVLAARDAGHDVHVGVPKEQGGSTAALTGLTIHPMDAHRGAPNLAAEMRYFWAIGRVMSDVQPDLIHAVTIRPVVFGGVLRRLLGVRKAVFSLTGLGFVFTAETRRIRVLRKMVELAFRFVFGPTGTAVIFENAVDRDLLVGRSVVSEATTRVFVGGGIDLDVYRFARPSLGDPPLVVMIGRMLADKGVREFVAAAQLLRQAGVPVRMVLVGDVDAGNPSSLSPAELQTYQAEGLVEWWGWRADIAAIIEESAVVCLPSYREGAPRTLIEAAAIGRPVVASNVPGCSDVVVDEVTGLLVPVRNAPALAAALRRLLADEALRGRIGLAARSHAETHFSSGLAIERMLSVYQDLLSRP